MYLAWAEMQRQFIAQLPAELGDVRGTPVLRLATLERRRRAVARVGRAGPALHR
jgi:hypothetical protein